MKGSAVGFRNWVATAIYRYILKPYYFRRDPEEVHDAIVRFGSFMGSGTMRRLLTRAAFGYQHPSLEQTVDGIFYPNPVGLAAGFDKNGRLLNFLPTVGFGAIEIGSITAQPSPGNPKPRLWRLPKSQSLIVHYGLANDGASAIAERLFGTECTVPVGINIAKTNSPQTVPTEAGIQDYLQSYRLFSQFGNYFTLNISCPNAYGGEPFDDPKRLSMLLDAITNEPKTKPIYLKFSPDLSTKRLVELVDVAEAHQIDGYVCTNLTKVRDNPDIKDPLPTTLGGFSGKVVSQQSFDQISKIYRITSGKKTIIGLGGIFTAEDAYARIRAGANLVQLITGMIYQGPQSVSEINRGLVLLLKRDGYTSISDVVGIDSR